MSTRSALLEMKLFWSSLKWTLQLMISSPRHTLIHDCMSIIIIIVNNNGDCSFLLLSCAQAMAADKSDEWFAKHGTTKTMIA